MRREREKLLNQNSDVNDDFHVPTRKIHGEGTGHIHADIPRDGASAEDINVRILLYFQEKMIDQENSIELEKMMTSSRKSKPSWYRLVDL